MKKRELTKEQQFGLHKKTGKLVTAKKPSSDYGVIEYEHPGGRKEILTDVLHFGMLNKLKDSFIRRGYIAEKLHLKRA